MTIETTRSIKCFWTGYFQDDYRKQVAIVTENKSVVTTDGEEIVAWVRRRGYNILTINEHDLKTIHKSIQSQSQTIKHTEKKKRAQNW